MSSRVHQKRGLLLAEWHCHWHKDKWAKEAACHLGSSEAQPHLYSAATSKKNLFPVSKWDLVNKLAHVCRLPVVLMQCNKWRDESLLFHKKELFSYRTRCWRDAIFWQTVPMFNDHSFQGSLQGSQDSSQVHWTVEGESLPGSSVATRPSPSPWHPQPGGTEGSCRWCKPHITAGTEGAQSSYAVQWLEIYLGLRVQHR